jgi:hypothetical protein
MPSPHAEIRRRFAEINYPAQSHGLPRIFSCGIAEPREGVGKRTKRSTSPGTAVVTGCGAHRRTCHTRTARTCRKILIISANSLLPSSISAG